MSEFIYCAGCGQPVATLDGGPSDVPLGCASDCPDISGGDES